MKLRAYLKQHGVTVDEFAEKHGWAKWGFRKWVYGQRVPGAADIAKIERVTAGEVSLRDWLIMPLAEDIAS